VRDALLSTKQHLPPLRPSHIPRPHLWQLLDAGLTRRWTLVSAPAGYGKTVLLSSWCAQSERRSAWLSLDTGDNDPRQFWRYFFSTLHPICGPFCAEALAALRSAESVSIRNLLTNLINQIAQLPQPFILVLDDYHHIKPVEIHHALIFLLDHLPEPMHLCFSTRVDPPFPLSRYRGRGELAELRIRELRFLETETAVYLGDKMRVNLALSTVRTVVKRTEGWVAGLQMAALSLQKMSNDQAARFLNRFTGNHRYVFDYLTDEVLDQQPAPTREILLQLSILERLCAPLCNAVLETSRSDLLLAELEAGNLFLFPLDERREWYRFHHLFAELLQRRLRQRQPDLLPLLHMRASRWFEAAGFVGEAIHHAQLADHPAWLTQLVERHILKALLRSEFLPAQQWLDGIPVERRKASPILCLAEGWLSLRQNSIAQAEQLFNNAQTVHMAGNPAASSPLSGYLFTMQSILSRTRGEAPQKQIALAENALRTIPASERGLRSMIALRLGIAYLDLGMETEAVAYCEQAVELGLTCGATYATCTAAYVQAILASRRGDLQYALTRPRQILAALPESERNLPVAGALPISIGCVLAERNDLSAAQSFLEHGMVVSASGGLKEARLKGQYALARVGLAGGTLDKLPDLVGMLAPANSDLLNHAATLQTRLNLIAARKQNAPHLLSEAVRWASAQRFQVEQEPDTDWRILAHLTHARVCLTQYHAGENVDLTDALRIIRQQLLFLEEMGWREIHLEALLVCAMLQKALGDGPGAQAFLEKSLNLAESSGYLRIFLDEGKRMAQLLYAALAAGLAPSYTGHLLAAFAAESTPPDAHPDLVEPLTKREREVLALIADGRANREIGLLLSISLGTVKRHTANINGKLNAHSRTEAVAIARALGILTD
jgi:LuxR family maltose regulon positive regulatory protein